MKGRIIAAIGAISSILTIFVFVTGIPSVPDGWLRTHQPSDYLVNSEETANPPQVKSESFWKNGGDYMAPESSEGTRNWEDSRMTSDNHIKTYPPPSKGKAPIYYRLVESELLSAHEFRCTISVDFREEFETSIATLTFSPFGEGRSVNRAVLGAGGNVDVSSCGSLAAVHVLDIDWSQHSMSVQLIEGGS